MKLKEITAMLTSATLLSAENAFAIAKDATASYSKSQAYILYGRSNVDRWLSEGLIQISNKRLNGEKLEAIAAASNRKTYLPVAER